jgi:hypothetical protein
MPSASNLHAIDKLKPMLSIMTLITALCARTETQS